MRILFDLIMFAAGVAFGVAVFQSAFHGLLAGAILAGATECFLGGRKTAR